MGPDTFNEVFRKSINIIKNEETTLLWHTSVLAVRTDKGIHFFHFACNLQCLDKMIDMVESSITCHKSSPAKKLFSSKFLMNEMKNIEVTEMIIDPSFWPHNPQLTQDMVNVLAMEWSPVDFINHHESVLAILNDVGGIEFYAFQQNRWNSVFDLSTALTEYYEEIMNSKENFDQLREAVYTVEPSSMCWAPQLNQNMSCYFVTAQKNCDIIFWCILSNEKDVSAKVVGKIQSELSEIVSVIWIPKSNEHFLLVCSDVVGQIKAFECRVDNDNVTLMKSHTLWSHKDRMIAKYLQFTINGEEIILICNKYRHLLVLLLDKNCNIQSQYLENINDYRITCITNSNQGIYVGTVNCKIYKINITVTNVTMNVYLDLIEMKDTYTTHELYSISFSPNNMFFSVGLIDRKIFCRKDNLKIDIIILSTDRKVDKIMSALLNNPTKKLTNFWEYIEMLRYRTMKFKTIPSIDYHQLYAEAEKDVYKLKVYLIIVTLYNNLKRILKLGSQDISLPELSVNTVKEKILVDQASTLITKLNSSYQKNGQLNSFEKESLVGAKEYLQIYSEYHKKLIDEYVSKDLLGIETECSYACQCCEDPMEGFTCQNGHLNMFCSISFTPIQDDDYLVCKNCNATVKTGLYKDKPLCIFCDLCLKHVY